MKTKRAPAPRGRPRAFDADKALDRALLAFWRKGYEGTSLTDLTRAMGINRPSLYAAFGDKEALFRKVLDRYEEQQAASVEDAHRAPTPRGFVERLLTGAAEWHTDPRTPAGCLMVSGALACGDTASTIRKELSARRAASEACIRRHLEEARSAGDLPADVDPAGLARYVITVIRGMAVQAAGGATRKELKAVVQTAMRAWPT